MHKDGGRGVAFLLDVSLSLFLATCLLHLPAHPSSSSSSSSSSSPSPSGNGVAGRGPRISFGFLSLVQQQRKATIIPAQQPPGSARPARHNKPDIRSVCHQINRAAFSRALGRNLFKERALAATVVRSPPLYFPCCDGLGGLFAAQAPVSSSSSTPFPGIRRQTLTGCGQGRQGINTTHGQSDRMLVNGAGFASLIQVGRSGDRPGLVLFIWCSCGGDGGGLAFLF